MQKTFGEKFRAERKKQGLTVKMIAETCGISRSYITLIENNQRLPGEKIIPKIAEALHLKTVVVLNWYLEHISHKMHKNIKDS